MKKLLSLAMIGAMYASMVMPCYASANNNTTSAADDYQIVTTTTNDDYDSSDVVILTEEQLIADGERIDSVTAGRCVPLYPQL
ncbi:MAG: hypothetical protein MR004_02885 [Clostridiales bacterium]|nr:hypothetical protein [Clostridiales bacterium]MDY4037297.1 hypothetical protein [Candidatus Pseudoscilispira sp.]